MIWQLLILAGLLVCAIQALRVDRLLFSALWLAGASALTALMMYLFGAYQAAVIELSVGAGLVTVLFVFAINIAGEETYAGGAILPRPLSLLLIATAVILLGVLVLPGVSLAFPLGGDETFAQTMWQTRRLDVLLQIAMIFSGVLGVLGFLSEELPRKEKSE